MDSHSIMRYRANVVGGELRSKRAKRGNHRVVHRASRRFRLVPMMIHDKLQKNFGSFS